MITKAAMLYIKRYSRHSGYLKEQDNLGGGYTDVELNLW